MNQVRSTFIKYLSLEKLNSSFNRMNQNLQILLAVCFLILGVDLHLSGQAIRTEFGKNRVQYHDDFNNWSMYETENFIVYWYGKGRNIAQTSVQIAEYVHPNIQNLVEHRINDKIEIIVYTDVSDLLQSNIGNEETFETRNETTKVIGSRIFVYFDGNHRNLERKIKKGIAQVYFNAMYSQGSLQEIIDSDPDLNVPTWYREGFVSYSGSNWDFLIEDELRDLWHIKKGKYRKFNKLANDHPRVAGHAMWHYLAQEYGRTSITTMLYLMRLRNDFNENVEFVFGFDLKKLKKDWTKFYERLYTSESEQFIEFNEEEKVNLGYKKWFPKSVFKLSPDGNTLIYVANENGKFKMILRDLKTGDQDVIFKYGSKNKVQQTDWNYPIVAWHPTRPEVTFCYEHRDAIRLRKLNLSTGEFFEQEIPENFQRLYSIDYVNEEEYLFNAVTEGFSDLYLYRPKSRQHEQITKDFYDDVDASYVQLGQQWGILFSSNRPTSSIIPERLDTILPTAHFNVFFLPLDSDFALQLTNTPEESEYQPKIVDGHYLTFLKSSTGINNRWVVDLNSRRKAYPVSNFSRNIINHESNKYNRTSIYQTYNNGAYEVYIDTPNWNESKSPYLTSTANKTSIQEANLKEEENPIEIKRPTVFFESEFEDPEVLEPLETNAKFKTINRNFIQTFGIDEDNKKVIDFEPARSVAARRQFKLEQFITRADNEVLFEGLESYADLENQIQNQEVGILFKGIAKDIFEDYKIELGLRMPTDFKGSEFFVIVDDRKKRIDKRFALYRKQRTRLLPLDLQRERELTWIGLHRQSYPFDAYRSVRATGQLRVDQNFLLHSDLASRNLERLNEKRMSVKLEYIFDNTLDIDLNLRHGTKYKAYVEAINRFDLDFDNGFNFDASRGFTTVFGFDGRHYEQILRNSILAFRLAGASSFGSDKILYYVGGTDGWVGAQFDQATPVPSDDVFAYKTIAPNLRGFNHNVRNGRTFLLGSAELRIPIVKYLSNKELKSKFLRNIQITGFVDVGSAWHGLFPNSNSSPINQQTISGPRVVVDLELDKTIFAYSYGAGARISLFGYFVRADYAWGTDSGFRQKPKLHISLGTDF